MFIVITVAVVALLLVTTSSSAWPLSVPSSLFQATPPVPANQWFYNGPNRTLYIPALDRLTQQHVLVVLSWSLSDVTFSARTAWVSAYQIPLQGGEDSVLYFPGRWAGLSSDHDVLWTWQRGATSFYERPVKSLAQGTLISTRLAGGLKYDLFAAILIPPSSVNQTLRHPFVVAQVNALLYVSFLRMDVQPGCVSLTGLSAGAVKVMWCSYCPMASTITALAYTANAVFLFDGNSLYKFDLATQQSTKVLTLSSQADATFLSSPLALPNSTLFLVTATPSDAPPAGIQLIPVATTSETSLGFEGASIVSYTAALDVTALSSVSAFNSVATREELDSVVNSKSGIAGPTTRAVSYTVRNVTFTNGTQLFVNLTTMVIMAAETFEPVVVVIANNTFDVNSSFWITGGNDIASYIPITVLIANNTFSDGPSMALPSLVVQDVQLRSPDPFFSAAVCNVSSTQAQHVVVTAALGLQVCTSSVFLLRNNSISVYSGVRALVTGAEPNVFINVSFLRSSLRQVDAAARTWFSGVALSGPNASMEIEDNVCRVQASSPSMPQAMPSALLSCFNLVAVALDDASQVIVAQNRVDASSGADRAVVLLRFGLRGISGNVSLQGNGTLIHIQGNVVARSKALPFNTTAALLLWEGVAVACTNGAVINIVANSGVFLSSASAVSITPMNVTVDFSGSVWVSKNVFVHVASSVGPSSAIIVLNASTLSVGSASVVSFDGNVIETASGTGVAIDGTIVLDANAVFSISFHDIRSAKTSLSIAATASIRLKGSNTAWMIQNNNFTTIGCGAPPVAIKGSVTLGGGCVMDIALNRLALLTCTDTAVDFASSSSVRLASYSMVAIRNNTVTYVASPAAPVALVGLIEGLALTTATFTTSVIRFNRVVVLENAFGVVAFSLLGTNFSFTVDELTTTGTTITPAPKHATPVPTTTVDPHTAASLLIVVHNDIQSAAQLTQRVVTANNLTIAPGASMEVGYNSMQSLSTGTDSLDAPRAATNVSAQCDGSTWCGRFVAARVAGVTNGTCVCTCSPSPLTAVPFVRIDSECIPRLVDTTNSHTPLPTMDESWLLLPSSTVTQETLTESSVSVSSTASLSVTVASESNQVTLTSSLPASSTRPTSFSVTNSKGTVTPSRNTRTDSLRLTGTAGNNTVTAMATHGTATLTPSTSRSPPTRSLIVSVSGTQDATRGTRSSSLPNTKSRTVVVQPQVFLLPAPVLSVSAATTQQTVVTTAAASGAALASPGAAMQAARAMAVLALSQCRFDYNAEAAFPISLWPGFNIDASRGLYYRGAVVAALSTLVFAAALGLVITLLLARRFAPASEKLKRHPSPAYAAKRLHFPGILTLVVGITLDGLVTSATVIFLHGENRIADVVLTALTVVLLVAFVTAVSFVSFTLARVSCSFSPRALRKETSSIGLCSRIDDAIRGSHEWVPLDDFDEKSELNTKGYFLTPKNAHGAVGSVYKKYRGAKQWFYIADVSLTVGVAIAKGTMPQTRTGCWVALGVVLGLCAIAFVSALLVRPYTAPIKNALLVGTTGLTLAAVCLVFIAVWSSNEGLMHTGQVASLLAGYVALGNIAVAVYTEFSQQTERRLKRQAKKKRVEEAARQQSRLNAVAFSTLHDDGFGIRPHNVDENVAGIDVLSGGEAAALPCDIPITDVERIQAAATQRPRNGTTLRHGNKTRNSVRNTSLLGGGAAHGNADLLDGLLNLRVEPPPLNSTNEPLGETKHGHLHELLHSVLRRAPVVPRSMTTGEQEKDDDDDDNDFAQLDDLLLDAPQPPPPYHDHKTSGVVMNRWDI